MVGAQSSVELKLGDEHCATLSPDSTGKVTLEIVPEMKERIQSYTGGLRAYDVNGHYLEVCNSADGRSFSLKAPGVARAALQLQVSGDKLQCDGPDDFSLIVAIPGPGSLGDSELLTNARLLKLNYEPPRSR